MTPVDFFAQAVPAAIASGHIWPDYAVCEAALESGWGESQLCKLANNLFGQKRGYTSIDQPFIELPTTEIVNGAPIHTTADWPKFASWREAFAARMNLLRCLGRYADSLTAGTGEEYVRDVSRVWATDPLRADKVLAIYRKHQPEIAAEIAKVA